jgi:hypothetical protein
MIHRLSTGQSISVASPDKTFRSRSSAAANPLGKTFLASQRIASRRCQYGLLGRASCRSFLHDDQRYVALWQELVFFA